MSTQIKEIKIEDGIYIPSIEAQWIYGANISDEKNYKVNEEFLDKLLKGKLNYSFELYANISLMEAIEIKTTKDGKQYTLDVVNVKYNKKYTKAKEEKTTKELRDWTYENGFMFNGKKLSNWKRSTGKAKEGDNMFLLDDVRDKCLDWARMNLKFKGKVDIGGIRAYESLPLSSIVGCINNLEPKNILIVDDFKSKFPQLMSKTWLEGTELKTETIKVEESNSIWDGEGLLSNEIFESNEIINGKGVALLRNRYMKCAGFNTRISEFYKDYCKKHKLNYDEFEVEDMYGNKILAKEIQLITTPSAIKLKKYNNEVCKVEGYEGDGAWLKYWKDNCGTSFGICKYEKPSHNCVFDENGNVIMYKNILSYQMVNTIPFKKDELKALVEPEIQYVERLKNDLDFFLQEVTKESNIEIECEDDEECEIQDEFKIGADIDITSAFVELCKKNSDFQNTRVFKDYRRNYIDAYVNRLRAGKIHINDADYAIVCGNPIELLYSTVKEFNGESITLKGNELYCSRFKENGINVVGFRSPHIMISNCGVQVNQKYEEITKYMNSTDNIVYINAIGIPIQSTYSGLDYDIDSILLTIEPLVTKPCSRINNSKFPVPYNGIKNTGDNAKELTPKNMSDVDNIICQNNIGSDINLSQELNSLMNNELYNFDLKDKEYCIKEHNNMINEIYDMVSKANAISNVEIDKSKKQFEKLDVPKELRKMKDNMEVVDNVKVRLINNKIKTMKKELSDKNKEIMKYRSYKRKPYNKRINEINNILRIDDTEKLTDDAVKLLEDKISLLKSEITKIKPAEKDKRKPINKEIREIEKILKENAIEKLTEEDILKLKNEIDDIKVEINLINIERENEISAFKNEIKLAKKELSSYDKRRIKPYFFKFIGDNESKKQRKKTNAKHRRELDKPIILKFAKDKGIDIKDVNLKDKELKKLLKVNDKIQKEWEDKVYIMTDTPMDWLQIEVNGIKNKGTGADTIQVIQLVKKDKHKATNETVKYIVNNIKNLDVKIKAFKLDSELNSKEKYNKMKSAKDEVVGNMRYVKITRADIFEIIKQCLNSVKKNGKIDKTTGVESLTLELLFKAFGTKLLNMFL